jgi:hypothetical protein
MRIGIICPSEIAFRRFMPALTACKTFEYAGVAVADAEEWGGTLTEEMRNTELAKAQNFVDNYGGKIFGSYTELIESSDVDAVYLPLPPALHYKWGKKVLENGKHLFLEKPSTTSASDTNELILLAKKKNLAIHENYMFAFHNQIQAVNDLVASGEIGDVRLYRVSFGFPRRAANDFRYNKSLGGGALIDAGGYTIKYATMLLGESAEIKYAQMDYTDEFDVDIYGSATLTNSDGVTAQIAYGMDNNYKCELEVWCSKGFLTTGRILTAPVGFVPEMTIRKGNEDEVRKLPSDDSFGKSIVKFAECITNTQVRNENFKAILKQAELVDKFRKLAEN